MHPSVTCSTAGQQHDATVPHSIRSCCPVSYAPAPTMSIHRHPSFLPSFHSNCHPLLSVSRYASINIPHRRRPTMRPSFCAGANDSNCFFFCAAGERSTYDRNSTGDRRPAKRPFFVRISPASRPTPSEGPSICRPHLPGPPARLPGH